MKRGKGFIARIVDESCGLIWWMLRPNHFQSVWFDRKHTFLLGMNLCNHDLGEIFHQGELRKFSCQKTDPNLAGDPVNFLVEGSTSGPTNWVARQVLVTGSIDTSKTVDYKPNGLTSTGILG